MADYMLSTSDNPFNPYKDWDQWYAYDTLTGYHTCGYLARIVYSAHELSDEDQEVAIDDAIDEILDLNINGKYVKVTPQMKTPTAAYPEEVVV